MNKKQKLIYEHGDDRIIFESSEEAKLGFECRLEMFDTLKEHAEMKKNHLGVSLLKFMALLESHSEDMGEPKIVHKKKVL